jgi:hypothetical protein
MILKEVEKGLYKVYRQTHSISNHHGTGNNKTYRDWMSVRARSGGNKGIIHIETIYTPKELLGKKIEIYVRIKEDVKSSQD